MATLAQLQDTLSAGVLIATPRDLAANPPLASGVVAMASIVTPYLAITVAEPLPDEVLQSGVTLALTAENPAAPVTLRAASVVTLDRDRNLAVLRLREPAQISATTDPILSGDAPAPGAHWQASTLESDTTASRLPSRRRAVSGIIVSSEGWPHGEPMQLSVAAAELPERLRGAPIIVNDQVVGLLSTGADQMWFGIPASVMRELIVGARAQSSSGEGPWQSSSNAPLSSVEKQAEGTQSSRAAPNEISLETEEKEESISEKNAVDPAVLAADLSDDARAAVGRAEGIRWALGRPTIHMEYLALALYDDPDGPARTEANRAGVDESKLRGLLERLSKRPLPALGRYETIQFETLPPLSGHVRKAFSIAAETARSHASPKILTEHLLYGLLSVEECKATKGLEDLGFDRSRIDLSPLLPPDGKVRIAEVAPDAPKGDDLLDVEDEVRAICAVIADKNTKPPLSIGLFGDWGTGKSFFMYLMEERIKKLAEVARQNAASSYCPNIVQIRFNAWTYIDADLWASLAAEIFEGLARALKNDEALLRGEKGKLDATANRASLLAATVHLGDLKSQAEQRKAQADAALRASEERLSTLAEDERALEANLQPKELVRSVYKFVSSQPKTATDLEKAAKTLGIKDAKALANDTHATLLELQGNWVRVRAIALSLGGRSMQFWIVLVVSAVLFAALIARLQTTAPLIGPSIATALGLLTSALAFVKRALPKVQSALSLIQKARQENKGLIDRECKRREDQLRSSRKAIADQVKAEEATISRVNQELAEIERELESLRADRKLGDFIKERSNSTEYRKHFGVIARARHDFEQLTTLLEHVAKEDADLAKTAEQRQLEPVPRINRIVLYVDDLDRCPESKVVDVLQAVHLLLAFPLFIVVVGVDSRWLLHSLRQHATAFRVDVDDDLLEDDDEVHWESTPFNYLEKIFQIPFNLQPMNKRGFERLIDSLTTKKTNGRETTHATGLGLARPESAGSQGLATDGSKHPPTQQPSDARVIGKPDVSTTPKQQGKTSPGDAAPPNATADTTGPSTVGATGGNSTDHSPPVAVTTTGEDIDPHPEFLNITDDERLFMHKMRVLIPTPRAAKRYVNVYRLLRSTLDEGRRAKLDKGKSGECQRLLLLLAIVTGFPQEGAVVLRKLIETPPTGPWWEFFDTLAAKNIAAVLRQDDTKFDRRGGSQTDEAKREARREAERRQRAQRWEDLRYRMVQVRALLATEGGEQLDCESFVKWSLDVARYSFESGRVLTAARSILME